MQLIYPDAASILHIHRLINVLSKWNIRRSTMEFKNIFRFPTYQSMHDFLMIRSLQAPCCDSLEYFKSLEFSTLIKQKYSIESL